MPTAADDYRPEEIEPRWQARWVADGQPPVQLGGGPVKHYNLVEFPYPSAEGLHVGHVFNYCGADVVGRHQRMLGRQVFQPIGFDAFGIHTENFALATGQRPDVLTRRTVDTYRRQLRRIGAAWAWSHEVVTSDPAYYRWTQWLFLRLHAAGLAVRREAPVVWCPSCLTVLAHEQLEDGRCERCRSEVTRRVMEQWFLRITAYADRLLDGLDALDWPESAKQVQRAWIGRSRGVEVDFALAGEARGGPDRLTAFTTRPDTLFGVTFLAISTDHPDAAALDGRLAVSPATGEAVPIVVAEHVVAGYGTGVVMGVPAHDERDHALAMERGLPVRTVIDHPDAGGRPGPWTGPGRLVASCEFTGLESDAAADAIADWLERRGTGRRTTRYRLHDWLISRQRYWGPPIPIVHCPGCGPVPVPEADLPVLLPVIADTRPTGTGASPLAADESFVRTACPTCGAPARRETDVSDTFFDSAWYFLRYPSAHEADRPWDPEVTARMLPVDLYAGGPEHVARHHLYARFTTMALHDLGLLPFAEPFPKLRLHGMIELHGAKMSKSRGNVVNPDDYVDRVGADNLRLYLLFCGDWQEGAVFSDAGLGGILRFTRRVWRLLTRPAPDGPGGADLAALDRATARVGRDVERLKLNTAIATLMETTRWLEGAAPAMSAEEWSRAARTLTLLLAPFAPHLAEELWSRLGGDGSVHSQRWPGHDAAALTAGAVTLVVQVDGRVRGRAEVAAGLDRDAAVAVALRLEAVARHLGGRTPRRAVHVPDRLVNLVT